MDPEQRELFRLALLKTLDANGSKFGLTIAALTVHVARWGFRTTPAEMGEEIQYCADKGLAVRVEKLVSPDVIAWRITAAGRDLLAAQSL